nr:MAG TPA: Protein-export protein SecB, Alkaline phosphatase chaperone, CHAPERONE-HYDROLASE complex [Caudoviricetes sp.]
MYSMICRYVLVMLGLLPVGNIPRRFPSGLI